MKKYFLISALFLISCSAKRDLQSVEWKKGEPLHKLQELDGMETLLHSRVKSSSEFVDIQVQSFSGIPVEDSFLKSLKNASGDNLRVRASLTFEDEKIKKLLLKDFKKNRETFLKELQAAFPLFKKFPPETLEPVIAHRRGFYEPLWRVVYFDGKGVPWEVRLNNHLQVQGVKRVGSQFHDTMAFVFPRGPKQGVLQQVLLRGLRTQPTLANERLLVSSQADLKISSVTDPLRFNPQDSRFDQVQVFYYLEESLNWFEKKLNLEIPFPLQAEVHVGFPEKTNAAFYYQGKIRFGAGDDETYAHLPQDPSIVIHESVHALVESLARLPYEGEGGSLNEAFADFFTALQLDNPNMGEGAYLKGPFKRSLLNDLKVADKNGGLYHDSGIVSGTLWNLRQKLGAEKARQMALLTLNRLVPSSDFKDFGKCLKEVLPQVLTNPAELEMAESILAERGFQ